MGLLKQFAVGVRKVVAGVADVRDRLPVDVADHFQPVIEARALRPWELLDEGIESFGVGTTVAAVAAEFGGFAVLPRDGYFTVVTFLRADAAGTYSLRLSVGNPFAGGGVVSAVSATDTRILPPGAQFGSGAALDQQAAQAGTQLYKLANGQEMPAPVVLRPPPRIGFASIDGDWLVIWHNTVNTGFDVNAVIHYVPAIRKGFQA